MRHCVYGQKCYTAGVDFPGRRHEAQIKFAQVTEALAGMHSRSAVCQDLGFVHLCHLEMKHW